MLILLPTGLLVLAAFVILVLQRTRPGFAYSWLVAVGVSLVVWVIFLVFRWIPPASFYIDRWFFLSQLAFTLDNAAWIYAFSSVSLMFSVILTAPARLLRYSPPWALAGNLTITGVGLLAILAGNPLTLILAWSGLDLIELVLILGGISDRRLTSQTIAAFILRVMGSFVVVWASVSSLAQGIALSLINVMPETGLFLLLAASLRLGIVPLYIPHTRDIPTYRGLGIVLRLVVPASSLVVLGRLSDIVLPVEWALYLSVATALAALYGSLMWLMARNSLEGHSFMLISLASMAVACVVRGQPQASIAWGVALLISGGLLFLYTARDKKILFVPLIGFLGLSGMPFTPTAGGWSGLIVFPFNSLDILFIIVHLILLLGYARHSLSKGEEYQSLERWIQVLYPVGLLFPVITIWGISLMNPTQLVIRNIWWAGLFSLLFAAFGVFMLRQVLRIAANERGGWAKWLVNTSKIVAIPLANIISLGWLYRVLSLIYRFLQRFIYLTTVLIEGDGGVLWTMLLLVLLISLIRAGGVL